jgi:hypothetical protein
MTSVTVIAMDELQPIVWAQAVDGGPALDVVSYTAFAGASIRSCPSLPDTACSTGSTWQKDSDAGVVAFALPQSFGGYFDVSGPQLFTTRFFPGPFVAGDGMTVLPLLLLTFTGETELQTILPGVNVSHDMAGGLGHIFVSVLDCNDHFAPGVTFVPSNRAPASGPYLTTVFYTVSSNGQELPSTSAQATDQAGAGGIFNVPAGGITLSAYRNTMPPQKIGAVDVLVDPALASVAYVRARTH